MGAACCGVEEVALDMARVEIALRQEVNEDVWPEAPALEAPSTAHFEVVLEKTQPWKSMGLLLDMMETNVQQIVGVAPGGLAMAHNELAPHGKRILHGLFLLAVNGRSEGSKEMLKAMEAERVTLLLAPAEYLQLTVDKAGRPLGLRLSYQPGSPCLLVRKVLEGAVADHNAAAGPGDQLRDLDRIMQVNDVRGTALQLMDAIKTSDRVHLRVVRPMA